jgi:SNF2 family DNA or RNA helicase
VIPKSRLTPEQLAEIDWLTYRTEALFFLPIGFGKTICTLTAIQNLRRMHPDWRTLVVSTKSIIEHTWGTEVEAWEHIDMTYASAAGRKLDVLQEPVDILGINFESLEWYYDQLDAGVTPQREILVIDESSKMKSSSAKRVKRHIGGAIRTADKVHFRGGYVDRYKRRFALSGTPAPESYEDLWAQEACVSTRRRLTPNKKAFHEEYCTPSYDGFGWDIPERMQRRIEKKIAPITHMPRAHNYVGIPEPIHRAIEVPWTDPGWDQYIEMETTLSLGIADGATVEAEEAAGKINKLRQICSGFVYDSNGYPHPTMDTDLKADALDEIISRSGDTPLLVFTQFVEEMDYLGIRYPEAQIGLPKSLVAWNNKKIPMMILHPASAGHGLNLQVGSHICVFYSMPYSYEQWMQAWGRLHRRGQTERVSVLRLERKGSIEPKIYSAVQNKDLSLARFLMNLRDLQAKREAPKE